MPAKDVEVNVTASDSTGPGLDSVERRFKRTSDRVKSENDKNTKDVEKLTSGTLSKVVGLVEQFSPKLAQSLSSGLASGSGALGPALIAVVAGAAPGLGAVVSAAVLGGAGIGGVIGGVLLASQDARVQGAGKALGTSLLGDLNKRAGVFVQPVLAAIDTIQARYNEVSDSVGRIFQNASRFVAPLVDGATRAVQSIVRGIDKAVASAGPVIAVISGGIAEVGDAIGDVFAELSDNGPEAGLALKVVFDSVATSIRVVGAVVNALTEAFGFMVKAADALHLLHGPAKDLYDDLKQTEAAGDANADAIQRQADAAAEAVEPLASLSDTLEDVASSARNLYDSTTNVEDSVAKLTGSIKENGKTLDVHTEKGRANRKALSDLAGALDANYSAYVKVNGEGSKANEVAAQNRAAFIKAAQGFGIGRAAAEQLANQIGLIPAKKATEFTANTHDAAGRISALQEQINALRNKTVTITVARRVTGSTASDSALAAALGKQGNFDAFNSFAFAGSDAGAGGLRIGGNRPVTVNNDVAVRVLLDGSVIGTVVDTKIRESEKRQNFKRQVAR